MRRTLPLLLALVMLAPSPAVADAPLDLDPSNAPLAAPVGHRDLSAEHAQLPAGSFGYDLAPMAVSPLLMTGAGSTAPLVTREVWGYLPYWGYSSSAAYVPARWDLITIMMWFNVEMDVNGDIEEWRGWGGDTTAAIVQAAHAHGVKLVVTVTNFNDGEIGSIVNSATKRANAIDTLLDVMAMHNADGVNIDFEFVPKSGRDGFKVFMADLKAAVAATQPNGHAGHVSLAGPSVDWNNAYDYDVLLESTDGIMVMAYGYHWGGGSPGPTSPLFGGSPWGTHSVAWTIDDYLQWGEVENRHKIVIGLPWYGRNWPVPNMNVPTSSLGTGSAITFKAAEAEVDSYQGQFDDHTKTAYYHKTTSGQLRQVWYDDGPSFEAKVDYIDQMDLGGVGIWALSYEGSHLDLWDAIETVLVPEGVVDPPDPGPEPAPEPGPEPQPEVGPEPAAEPVADVGSVAEPPPADTSAATSEVSTGADSGILGPGGNGNGNAGNGQPPDGPVIGRQLRNVSVQQHTQEAGCAGSESGSPLWPLAALVMLLIPALRRRSV